MAKVKGRLIEQVKHVEEGEQRRKQRELKRCAAFTPRLAVRSGLFCCAAATGARVLLALESSPRRSITAVDHCIVDGC